MLRGAGRRAQQRLCSSRPTPHPPLRGDQLTSRPRVIRVERWEKRYTAAFDDHGYHCPAGAYYVERQSGLRTFADEEGKAERPRAWRLVEVSGQTYWWDGRPGGETTALGRGRPTNRDNIYTPGKNIWIMAKFLGQGLGIVAAFSAAAYKLL